MSFRWLKETLGTIEPRPYTLVTRWVQESTRSSHWPVEALLLGGFGLGVEVWGFGCLGSCAFIRVLKHRQ